MAVVSSQSILGMLRPLEDPDVDARILYIPVEGCDSGVLCA